ncbi:hypothetical protein AB205_0143110 [Aquarana catesbeiana]|uniref:Uncharacterized protein n=1 Tax=Aquarana catesbeiana TaxID=8400 RepID=A0A2G9RCR9_AQUCT|nr:hypothetical protein AB205_0143110 [Aquarana catesbeiana]
MLGRTWMMAEQVSGIMITRAWGEMPVENFKSCRLLPIAKYCRVATNDGLPHAGILPANIRGQQSQQTVKYGVRHPEKVPEIIRIILTDLTEQRHVTELDTLKQPILGP